MSKKTDPLAAAMALLAEAGKADEVDTSKLIINGHDYRNNDAVAVFANLPAHFRPGICKNCGLAFAVNKKAVGFCSDLCRREDWRKSTGLDWGAVSTHDVWNGDPPMIITPDQLVKLRAIAEWFTQNQTTLDIAADDSTEADSQVLEESQEFDDLFGDGAEYLQDTLSNLLQDQSRELEPNVWKGLPSESYDLPANSQDEPVLSDEERMRREADALFGF